MIATKTKRSDNTIEFRDNSADLDHVTLALVRAGLDRAAKDPTFRHFTTSVEDGESRLDWGVRTWLTMEKGAPVVRLVAYRVENEHFEVLKPEGIA